MQVLVVDDEAALRNLLVAGLQRFGITPDLARNGVEALEQIERNNYRVVLLDVMMPLLDGAGVLQRLASMSKRPAIILLSATTDRVHAMCDLSLVTTIVSKPFDLWLLVDVVHALAKSVEPDRRSERDRAEEHPL